MHDLKIVFDALEKKVKKISGLLDLNASRIRVKQLEVEMSDGDFWKDQENAKIVSQEFDDLKKELHTWDTLCAEIQESLELITLSEHEKTVDEQVISDLQKKYKEVEKQVSDLEFYILLGGKYDKRNAIIAIHAGAGGIDAQDWSEMLFRMLFRFCERKGWKTRIIEKAVGQEAGVKRVVFEVSGRYAYGYLQSEDGVHRLVRISPFDAEAMRHTSFSLIEVLPEFNEVDKVEIKEEDLRIDLFRSGGAGGQHVNKTDSAVRMVHKPTGITVVCQNERSQQQNRATALNYLKAKLHKLQQATQEAEKQKIRGEFSSAEWGSQIRSYVLHPYKLVKDHRTKYEVKDPGRVLDGNLTDFIEAYLRWKRKKQ